MDLMTIYLDSDPVDIGEIQPVPPRISIRCYRIPGIPGAAHCALYDGDNDRVYGAGPENPVPPLGCIRGYCVPYDPPGGPRSPEKQMEDACTAPLGCFRTTPIVCPDREAADDLMQCVSDYMNTVNDQCVWYSLLSGPNSNTTIHKALACCLDNDSGCSSPFTEDGRDPRTPSGTIPGAWAPTQGFDELPPCLVVE